MTSDQINELIDAVAELLAELDEVRGVRSECGECPPTVATEERLRAAVEAFTLSAGNVG